MRSFICALIVFVITAAAVIFLSVYTSAEATKLAELCDSLPCQIENDTEAEFDAVYRELSTKWEHFSKILQLTANHHEKDSICMLVYEIREYRKSDDQASYSATKAKLSAQLKNLKETESLSLFSIF